MVSEKRRDLIDRNNLENEIQRLEVGNSSLIGKIILSTISTIIKMMPTVDAEEVVHGRWEYGKWEKGHWVKGNERCRCSVCHRDFAVDNSNIWHGCPQCLAKMDGGNEDG